MKKKKALGQEASSKKTGSNENRSGGTFQDSSERLTMAGKESPKVASEDTVQGAGKECTSVRDRVTVHYRGTLMNGTEFDSSYKRGKPIEFALGDLIQGWQEGIPGMKVGGKRRLTIPWQMAYGERGSPPNIPPRSDLIFEIELLGVK